jgi:hypothetical protein
MKSATRRSERNAATANTPQLAAPLAMVTLAQREAELLAREVELQAQATHCLNAHERDVDAAAAALVQVREAGTFAIPVCRAAAECSQYYPKVLQ